VPEETPQPSKNYLPSTVKPRYFIIEVHSQFDKGWMADFQSISFSNSATFTRIEVLADQAALRGILNHLWDLNLDIFSVMEIGMPDVRNGGK